MTAEREPMFHLDNPYPFTDEKRWREWEDQNFAAIEAMENMPPPEPPTRLARARDFLRALLRPAP